MDDDEQQPEQTSTEESTQTDILSNQVVPITAYRELQLEIAQLKKNNKDLQAQVNNLKKELKNKENQEKKSVSFRGYESVKQANKVQELTAVLPEVFDALVAALYDYNPRSFSKEDYLLSFLLKLKTGLPFRVIAILFNVPSSTLNYNFFVILENNKYFELEIITFAF